MTFASYKRRLTRWTKYLGFVLPLATGFCYVRNHSSIAEISIAEINATQSISAPVLVEVTVINTSPQEIRMIETDPYRDYRVTLLDRNRHDVPVTRYGEEMRSPSYPLDRNFARTLQPKEQVRVELDLRKFFDIRQPGQYRASVTRLVYKLGSNSGVSVASKELAIRLTP